MAYEASRSSNGSMTVEAAVIVPFILLALIALIISFLIMYQKMLLISTASLAAQQAAEVWVDDSRNIENGAYKSAGQRLTLSKMYGQVFNLYYFNSPYIETFDSSFAVNDDGVPKMDERVKKIRQIVCSNLSRGVMKTGSTEMRILYSNAVVQKKIEVKLTQQIKLPMGNLISIFTGKDVIELTAEGVAVVGQPVEYIRNMDLIIEYGTRLGKKFNLNEKIANIKEKVLAGRR